MFPTLALALVALPLGSDTPIEPIPSAAIQMAVDTGILTESCTMYGQLVDVVNTLGPDFALFIELADGYAISSFETGWGESARMTDEARSIFHDYLQTCV